MQPARCLIPHDIAHGAPVTAWKLRVLEQPNDEVLPLFDQNKAATVAAPPARRLILKKRLASP
jgi:hypothetical protein